MSTSDPQTVKDDGRALAVLRLTGFQRDLLVAMDHLGPSSGQGLKSHIQKAEGREITHGQLYPNLDTLVEKGLVNRGQIDRRTNSYGLTAKGRREYDHFVAWVAGFYED